MDEMEIEQTRLAAIVPYDKNARINEGAISAVAESIRQFGFRNPILVDDLCVIICGHTRLLAAKSLGLETVPVIFCRDLSPENVRALRLADNRSSELSTWDMDLLMQELAALNDDGVDASAWFADELNALKERESFSPVDESDRLDQTVSITCPHCGKEFMRV